MGLEGELLVRAHVLGGRVGGTQVVSTRPDVACLLLQGRTRDEIVAAVPRLFSVCAHAQGTASRLACAAAAGDATSAAALARIQQTVVEEAVAETARSVLLQWPGWLGEQASPDALAAARGAVAWCVDMPQPAGAALAAAVYGQPAEDWLQLDLLSRLRRWADSAPTPAARLVAQALNQSLPPGKRSGPVLPGAQLLDGTQHAEWIAALAPALDADPGFALHPTWCGAPAETGPLARLQADPLVHALLQRPGARVAARFVARLRELALLLAGRTQLAVGALQLAPGRGLAWVENARGLLVHSAQFDALGRASSYRIVAPTDWNFHPAGAVALGLAGAPAADRAALQRQASLLVRSLDPCVHCRVEIDGA